MTENNNSTEKQNPKFCKEQCDFLKRCCDKKNMEEWNIWRTTHPAQDVLLEGANLQCRYLKEALLGSAPQSGFTGEVHLEQAKLHGALLENADFSDANLQSAKFIGANLKGTDFRYAHLQNADFSRAIVDGETLVFRCRINKGTKFEGVALGNMRIYPEDKQLLEYNIRRMNWEKWGKVHYFLKRLVWLFWFISDYGRSTGRIVGFFFYFATFFAAIYRIFPTCIKVEGAIVGLIGFLHAFYFSVVTMTTLGFGDIYANPKSPLGQILLMFQVLLGYFLLAALVTRFAVLFTAGGPAGKFSPMADETKDLLTKLEEDKRKGKVKL